MSEQHECEHKWHIFEESKDGAFCTKGCQGRLSRDEVESRLNEYETLKTENKRLKGGRRFPINMNGGTIPWEVAEEAYIAYSARFGTSQTLKRLGERGGFGISELDLLHPKWRAHERALAELETLKKATEALSAEDARTASGDTCYPDMWPDSVVPSLQAYADILEGK